MGSRTYKLGLSRSSPARAALATLFALALLSGLAPFASLAAGHFCSMPCCAGRAPHAEGSCAGGACHTHLKVKRHVTPENFCGLRLQPSTFARLHDERVTRPESRPIQSADKPNTNSAHGSERAAHDGERGTATQSTRVASSLLTHACPPDCCSLAVASSQLRRTQDSAALSHAGRARPPTLSSLAPHAKAPAPAHASPREQANPRAPPALS